jgi:hypothetical protein
MYFYLSSDDSKDKFPDNRASDFRIELPEMLKLGETSVVGVLDLYTPELVSTPTHRMLYVLSPICESSYLNGGEHPILCSFDQYSDDEQLRYSPVTYMSMAQRYLTHIHIYIRDHWGKEPSFKEEPTLCTLEINDS